MDALQACAAALGLFYSKRALDNPIYIQNAVIRLLAKIPTMVAAFQLMRKGNDPVQPRDDLDYAANFLYMLNEQEPDPLAASIFDICLTLHAEHTINASTFSAMVTASTLTDPYAVVASAVGTLAGPLHGGANEEVVDMLEDIGSVENVRPYLDKRIKEKKKSWALATGSTRSRIPGPSFCKSWRSSCSRNSEAMSITRSPWS
jgi:citrate synthase